MAKKENAILVYNIHRWKSITAVSLFPISIFLLLFLFFFSGIFGLYNWEWISENMYEPNILRTYRQWSPRSCRKHRVQRWEGGSQESGGQGKLEKDSCSSLTLLPSLLALREPSQSKQDLIITACFPDIFLRMGHLPRTTSNTYAYINRVSPFLSVLSRALFNLLIFIL